MGILVVDGIEASASSGTGRPLTIISPKGLIAAACFADEALNVCMKKGAPGLFEK